MNDEPISCYICGKKFHNMLWHIKGTHGLPKEIYASLFNDKRLYSDLFMRRKKQVSKKTAIERWGGVGYYSWHNSIHNQISKKKYWDSRHRNRKSKKDEI